MSDPNGATTVPANGASHDPAGASQVADPQTSEPPDWFKSFAETVDKRISDLDNGLGRRFEGFFEKKTKAKVEPEPKQEKQDSFTRAQFREEMNAAMRLGAATKDLSKEDREVIDEMLAEGMSYDKATRYAERLTKSPVPAKETAEAVRTAPPGVAATSAPRSSQAEYPKTQGEYFDLARQAGERETHGPNVGALTARAMQAAKLKAALDSDPMFHPEDLPRR